MNVFVFGENKVSIGVFSKESNPNDKAIIFTQETTANEHGGIKPTSAVFVFKTQEQIDKLIATFVDFKSEFPSVQA